MSDLNPDYILDEMPGAEGIGTFRDKAAETGSSIRVAYQAARGEERVLVVSERGTCVVLEGGVTSHIFNRNEAPAAIADALRTQDE